MSLLRLPLAAVFPWLASRPYLALAVLAASGLTDMIDGWYARKFDQVTATGAVVDPITDKVFVSVVVVTLVMTARLRGEQVVMMAAREIGELPLVLWFATSRAARQRQRDRTTANIPGKAATTLQFATVAAALFRWRHLPALVTATLGAGIVAAVSYWVRALKK